MQSAPNTSLPPAPTSLSRTRKLDLVEFENEHRSEVERMKGSMMQARWRSVL